MAHRRAGARDSDVSPRLYVAPSPTHGLGVFAAETLPRDLVLGRLLGMPTFEDGRHVLWLTEGIGLEVVNDFRFINHARPPNCMLTDVDVVTVKAIPAHAELFHDYGW